MFGVDMMESGGVIIDDAMQPMQGMFQEAALSSAGSRIAGGTDEILRNIIAERVLGLPQDIRVDKEVAFSDVPTGES